MSETPPPLPQESAPAARNYAAQVKPHALASSWMLASIAMGLVLYGAVVALFIILRQSGMSNGLFNFAYERLFMRGSIPHIMTIGLTIGLSLLLVRLPLLRREFRRLDAWAAHLVQSHATDNETLLENIPGGGANREKTLVDQTIHQIFVRSTTAENRAEMDGVVDQITSVERRKLDASHVPVRYLIWLIPTLGFLGTVLGISLAVSGFGEVINRNQGQTDMNSSLMEITRELGVAFDTTFVALIYSSLIALMMAYVDRHELSLLNAMEEFYALRIRPRLKFTPRAGGLPVTQTDATYAAYGAGGAGGGSVVMLQAPDGGSATSLEEVARQVVAESLASLSTEGNSIAQSLGDSGVAVQLKQFIEANLVHIRRQLDWMETSAIRKEDLHHLSETFSRQADLLANLVQRDIERQAELAATLERLSAVAEKLHAEGVAANVSINSIVTTPGRS